VKPFVIVLGIVFALAGLTVGWGTLKVTLGGETVSCAAPFSDTQNYEAQHKDFDNSLAGSYGKPQTTFDAACDSKRETYQILAGVGVVVGGGLFLAGLFIPGRRDQVTVDTRGRDKETPHE
jgi:hypothetical protein